MPQSPSLCSADTPCCCNSGAFPNASLTPFSFSPLSPLLMPKPFSRSSACRCSSSADCRLFFLRQVTVNAAMTSRKTAMNPTMTPISWRVLDWISGRVIDDDIIGGAMGEAWRIGDL